MKHMNKVIDTHQEETCHIASDEDDEDDEDDVRTFD
jgi:hypothetical protein